MQDSLKSIWKRLIRHNSACERYESLVSLYADGMASPKESRLVEAHIAACPSCRALLASIRVTTVAFTDQPAPEMPSGLSERLRLAILQERLREQAPASIPARTPVRSLMPRLALAGTFATVLLAAVLVYKIHLSSPGGQVAIKPTHIALVPTTKPSAPAIPIAPTASSPEKTEVAIVPGNTAKHNETTAIPNRRSTGDIDHASTRMMANAGVPVHPHISFTITHLNAIHSSTSSHSEMAKVHPEAPGSSVFTPPHNSGPMEARLPSSPAASDMHSDVHQPLPPAVSNSNAGVQPTVVASVPQTQPTPATAEDTPRVKLASRLHLIADNSAQAVQQMAKVTVNGQRQTEYSPSLAIVGNSFR